MQRTRWIRVNIFRILLCYEILVLCLLVVAGNSARIGYLTDLGFEDNASVGTNINIYDHLVPLVYKMKTFDSVLSYWALSKHE